MPNRRAPVALISLLLVSGRAILGQAVSAPAKDPVLTTIRSHEPDYADPKTRRLEVLTQIWGNVGLFDPRPSAWQLKWDDQLVGALRELPQVRSEREFADLINRAVFAPIGDPLLYAATREEDYKANSVPPTGTALVLGSGTAYVSAANRAYAPATFAKTVRGQVDSIQRNGSIRRLIIDLRADVRGSYREGFPDAWLGLWARTSLNRGPRVSVLRTTEDILGDVRWTLTPADSLVPIAPTVELPTVFVVNRTSYPVVEQTLDAIRHSRPDVAVVFEKSGRIPNLDYSPFQTWYPDSILLPHFHVPILSADGSIGSVVDAMATRPVALEELDSVAAVALSARAAQKARTPFRFVSARIRDDTITANSLTPEQRVAGLLKTWYWVAHFYAYLDDASADWRHLVSAWAPRVQAAKDEREYYGLLRQVSALLNDTHSNVQHPLSGFAVTGFSTPLGVGWVEDRLAVWRVDTVDARLGVHPGDEVVAVDGKSVREIERELLPLWSVSRPHHHVPLFFMLGPKDSRVSLRIRTPNGIRDVVLTRSRPDTFAQNQFDHPAFALLPGNLGYVSLARLGTLAMFDSAMRVLADTRGLIIDDRIRGSANTPFRLFQFIRDPAPWIRRVESMAMMHEAGGPVTAFGSEQPWTVPFSDEELPPYTKPLVVITWNGDVSRGESWAQWLRLSKRATFVGEPTNGTYGTRVGITLPGGAMFFFTAGRALWPDGTKYHGVGVVPDILIRPTLSGLRENRDELFDGAVRTLSAILKKPLSSQRAR